MTLFTVAAGACATADDVSEVSEAVTLPSYSTSFNGTENPISEGGKWVNLSGDWAKVRTGGGAAIGTQTGRDGYDDSYAHLTGFPPDTMAEATIFLNPNIDASCTHEVELLFRITDAPRSFKAYEVLLNFEGGVQFVKLLGPMGSFYVLPGGGNAGRPRTGDVFSAKIVGNRLTAYLNGREVASTEDPERDWDGNFSPRYTSGQPGIGFFKRECGTNEDYNFQSYTVTSIGGDAPPANASPTVSLTSPAVNSTFTAPASIALAATAADSDGSITQVEFFQGTTLLATDTSSPYSFTWTNVPAGSYQLTARATDNGGARTTSAMVPVTVNSPNAAPTVSLTSPTANSTFTAPASIALAATASDSDGSISKVEFFQGTTLLGSDTTSPYSFTWTNVPAGSYQITARATDNRNASRTSSAVSVTVNSPGNAAPTVSLTAPTANSTFTAPASIALAATASDSDGSISKVEFFQGTTLLGSDTTSPYSFTWTNVPAGSYQITARATDNGNATRTSSAVSITVTSPGNTPPTVSLTSPTANATFTAPASIALAATASDSNGSVSKVEFFQGTTLLATDTTSPYSFTWTSVPAGSYQITARATDNNNASTTSAAVTVTVANSPSGPISYSTSFDTNEAVLSEGGKWTNLGVDWTLVTTVNGMAMGTLTGLGGYNDSYAHLSGFGPDYTASAVVHLNPAIDSSCTHSVELLLRTTDGPRSLKAYEVILDFQGNIQFIKRLGPINDFYVLRGGARYYGLKTGDVFSATIVGNQITAFINGTPMATATDEERDQFGNVSPRYATGQPGIGFFRRACGANSDFGFLSFSASGL